MYRTVTVGLILTVVVLPLTFGGSTANVTATQPSPTIVSSSLEHIGGTEPDMENISLKAEFNDPQDDQDVSNLKLPVLYDTDRYTIPELERAGADRSTEFRITVVVEDYHPRNLRGTGQDLSWTRDFRDDGTVKITIVGKPIEVQRKEGSYGMDDWDGTKKADRVAEAQFMLFIRSFETHADTVRDRIDGTIIATDASSVGTPALRRDDHGRKRLELRVGAPHYTVDGDAYVGVYEAVLAPPLLDAWNVNSTDQLEAWYDGNATDFTATRLDDGSIRITMTPHYSSAEVAVGQEQSDLSLPLLVLWQIVFLYTKYTGLGVAALIVGAGVMHVKRNR